MNVPSPPSYQSSTRKSADVQCCSIVHREGLHVALEFRCQDYLDNRHPNYVGDAGIGMATYLAEMIKASDCLILVGARMGEMPTSGYSLLGVPHTGKTLLQGAGTRSGRPCRDHAGPAAAASR